MVKKCSTWALLNKYAFKRMKWVFGPHYLDDDGVWRHTKIVLKGKLKCLKEVKWNIFWSWPIWN